jgi:hypothetical protein
MGSIHFGTLSFRSKTQLFPVILAVIGLGTFACGCNSWPARGNSVFVSEDRVSQIVERAVVRITRGNVCGSGSVIGVSESSVIVLTNAHVVGTDRGGSCNVQFFRSGFASPLIEGRIVAASYSSATARDLALVSVRLADLQGYVPPVMPLAPQLLRGPVRSSGCPGCAWPSGWVGHVLRDRGDVVSFLPEPQPGRSGSPLFQVVNGRPFVVGVVTWSASGEDSGGRYGLAQTVRNVRAAFGGLGSSVPRAGDLRPVAHFMEVNQETSTPGTGAVVVPAGGSAGVAVADVEFGFTARPADDFVAAVDCPGGVCRPGEDAWGGDSVPGMSPGSGSFPDALVLLWFLPRVLAVVVVWWVGFGVGYFLGYRRASAVPAVGYTSRRKK